MNDLLNGTGSGIGQMKSDGTYHVTANQMPTIKVTADTYSGNISESEQQKAGNYVNTAGQGFTATPEDFKNKDIFLTNTLAGSVNQGSSQYNDKKAFIEKHGAIKPNEIDFWEGVRSDVDRDVSTVKGGVSGAATGVVNTVTGVIDYLSHPIDNTKALINNTLDAVKHPKDTAVKAGNAIEGSAEKYNTTSVMV